MTERPIVVVDIETSSLDPVEGVVLEVAAVNLDTCEELQFFPQLPPDWLARSTPEALAVNRFIERRGWAKSLTDVETDDRWETLWSMLEGATFAGANPHFDQAFIRRELDERNLLPAWSHRLLDLGSFACGVLHQVPTSMPSASEVMDALGMRPTAPHTALGDARAEAAAFRELSKRIAQGE